MFSQTTSMEQDPTNSHLALAKTNPVCKDMLLCKTYAILNINIKARAKNITPLLF